MPGGGPAEVPHAPAQTLGNISTVTNAVVPNEIDHYTVQRAVDVNANVEGSDLGTVPLRYLARHRRNGLAADGNEDRGARAGQGDDADVQDARLGLILAVCSSTC